MFYLGECNNETVSVSTSYDVIPCPPLQQPTNTKLWEDPFPSTDSNALRPDNTGSRFCQDLSKLFL